MAKKNAKPPEAAADVFSSGESAAYTDGQAESDAPVSPPASQPAPRPPVPVDPNAVSTYECVTECRWLDKLYRVGERLTIAGTKLVPSHFMKIE